MKLRLLPAFLFLGCFFFLPLVRILAISLDSHQGLVPGGSFYPRLLSVLQFTFAQALASTLLTLMVGLPLAYFFARYDFPGKSVVRALTAIPFMLPTVVVAAGFNALLGPRGWLNLLAGFHPPLVFVGTLGAILIAHVFYNATIVIRIVGNAWATLDTRVLDASRSLGASPIQTLMRVTLPLLRPSLLAAGLLVFLFDFTSYGVILLLGGPQFSTLEVEIYIQAMHFLNLPAAALLSLVQLLCTLGLSIVYSRYISRVTAPSRTRSVWMVARKPRSFSQKVLVGGLVLFCLLFFALPLVALPSRSLIRLDADRGERVTSFAPGLTFNYYTELFLNRHDSIFYVPPVQAAFNSLTYALLTVLFSLLMGFPAAMALARPGKLEKWLDPLLMLPLGASAVTLGLGYIVTFNRPISLPGFSGSLLSSPLLVPLAHTTIALPFVIRNLQTAMAAIPERAREAAAVLGANRWQVWWQVDLPILSRAVASAGAFAFTVSMGEFGAASLLARPDYPTLPTAIYRFLSQPGGMNYGQAMAMASLLMLLTGASIVLIEKLRLPGDEL